MGLRLERGKATAQLERERRKARQLPGTTVVLLDLEPDVLSRRRTPRRRRRVAIVGRAGTTIVDDIVEIEEFALPPWESGQVTGEVVFAALQQTAGRRAVLRDRDAFPVFVDAVKSVEPAVRRPAEKLIHEVDAQVADRLAETLRRIFGRVIKELGDLDNPMRTRVGDEHGGGLFEQSRAEGTGPSRNGSSGPTPSPGVPELPELDGSNGDAPSGPPPRDACPDRRRTTDLPSVTPDPNPGDARSRFDAETGIVFYNDRHEDYLVVGRRGRSARLPRDAGRQGVRPLRQPSRCQRGPAEEMVRVLVRVRRHLPRRREPPALSGQDARSGRRAYAQRTMSEA